MRPIILHGTNTMTFGRIGKGVYCTIIKCEKYIIKSLGLIEAYSKHCMCESPGIMPNNEPVFLGRLDYSISMTKTVTIM